MGDEISFGKSCARRAAVQMIAIAAMIGMFVIGAVGSDAFAGPAGGATAAVKASNDSIRGALKKMVAARGTPGWKAAREQARTAVGGLLDYEALAKATLGKHWDEVKPAERTRYIDAMRSAMEASYLTKMQGKVAVDEVQVDYLGEDAKGPNTVVHTQFHYGKDGAKLDFVMEPGKKPRALDVITEDVSLADTYHEQIDALWAKKGISGITETFEKKAKKLEAELETTQASASNSSAPAASTASATAAPATSAGATP